MPQTLKKQALTLTIANGFTRGLGFLFRLMTARLMGAEAIGVMELSASAAMLALTPATAGLPTAMSRVTARPNADQSAVLRAGLSLNRRIALVMMPLLFLLATFGRCPRFSSAFPPCFCWAAAPCTAGGSMAAAICSHPRSANAASKLCDSSEALCCC